MTKVITWKTATGEKIKITPKQEALLKQNNTWPKDSRGEEYAQVFKGLHFGTPSYTDKELLALCGVEA